MAVRRLDSFKYLTTSGSDRKWPTHSPQKVLHFVPAVNLNRTARNQFYVGTDSHTIHPGTALLIAFGGLSERDLAKPGGSKRHGDLIPFQFNYKIFLGSITFQGSVEIPFAQLLDMENESIIEAKINDGAIE
ncbi:MAG: hypothetical protein WC028_02940 [Candidatus Obscuribacterales bacterium]